MDRDGSRWVCPMAPPGKIGWWLVATPPPPPATPAKVQYLISARGVPPRNLGWSGSALFMAASYTRLRAMAIALQDCHWWSWSKFVSHHTRRTNGVSEHKTDVNSTWITIFHQMNHVHLDCFQKPPLEGRPNMRPWHSELSKPLSYYILSCVTVWGPHMSKNLWKYHLVQGPWQHYMILSVLGRFLDIFFWVVKISWSQLLGRAWSGPH